MLRLTLFSLQRFIRVGVNESLGTWYSPLLQEEEFAQVFLTNNGLSELVDVIYASHGNTLAVCAACLLQSSFLTLSQYALAALHNLMELDYGWSRLEDTFILHIVRILSSSQSLVNVCRPATAILKKLVEADPSTAPGPGTHHNATNQSNSVYQYGFAVVFEQIRKEPGMLETVVGRLGSADTAMAQHRFVPAGFLDDYTH